MSRTNAEGRGRDQGQIFQDKDEYEDKILDSRPTCPRGLNITAVSKSEVKTFRKYVHENDIALQTPGQPPSDQQHPAAPGAH